jgi:formylglycine-generating enzyme required for sulfatase activity
MADSQPNPAEQKRLLALMLDGQRPPPERAEAGRAINQAGGDPRPGVVDFNWGEAYWCKVPAGEFIYGGDTDDHGDYDEEKKIEIPYDYWMGKYPITYAQWQAFLKDAHGYGNARWWKGFHAEGQAQQAEGPGEQEWKFANHPAENVSWYDAMAFCAWLNERQRQGVLTLPDFILADYEIRLPTDHEWEKAARGTDGREYPWGNGYQTGFANIDEARLGDGPYDVGMTTAVGIYLSGASPYGVLDMAGNVLEWCRTDYRNYTGDDKNISSNGWRVLHGGSWFFQADNARAFIRFRDLPKYQDELYGFRVVCAAPIG